MAPFWRETKTRFTKNTVCATPKFRFGSSFTNITEHNSKCIRQGRSRHSAIHCSHLFPRLIKCRNKSVQQSQSENRDYRAYFDDNKVRFRHDLAGWLKSRTGTGNRNRQNRFPGTEPFSRNRNRNRPFLSFTVF